MINCVHCGKPTKNPKFCSRNCAAKVNNVLKPKRQPEGICRRCQQPTNAYRTYCLKCWNDSDLRKILLEAKDKEESLTVHAERILKIRDLYRFHCRVRNHARKLYFDSFTKPKCERCGYVNYIEVAHIKPIRDFDKQSHDYSEINNISNLVGLCPNCHWEFDNKKWDISKIDRFKSARRDSNPHESFDITDYESAATTNLATGGNT